MCGIYSIFSDKKFDENIKKNIVYNYNKIKHRGPDNSKYEFFGDKVFLGFHRLSINDVSERGNQPFKNQDNSIYLVCNGEIYNSNELKENYKLETNSDSDCEVILKLYEKIGIDSMVRELDGVFSFVLYDKNINEVFIARDPIGVRSLFIGTEFNNKEFDNMYGVSSELKGLSDLFTNVVQFPPGTYLTGSTKTFNKYYDIEQEFNKDIYLDYGSSKDDYDIDMQLIKKKLTNAVKKRMLSDRPIGCLLSGGLDSSLIAALLSKELNKSGIKLNTFSVGLQGSTDLYYSKLVANHIGSEHHELILSEEEMLSEIENTIYQLETYDTTTIRAGTPMFILSKYIKENFNFPVIYSGEGSDEASGSYLYFHNTDNPIEFKKETNRLMKDLCYFDVLRCDKSTAGAGLEVRVPFLDLEFLDHYMNIYPEFKMPSRNNIEKKILRQAFENDDILPSEVLWRTKEGMSDGVSSIKRGWYQIINEHISKKYTDDEYEKLKKIYKFNTPQSKESLYYRITFDKFFNNMHNTIPYYWLPKWSGDIKEPSARVLSVYKQ